jgi:nucleoside-diphosphate-sugar epimerase
VDIQHGSPYGWPAESLAPFRTENGGLLADMGVHYLDLAENLAGGLSPAWYEDDYRGGVEADLSFSLRSEAGVEIRLALSRIRTLANRVVLTGTAGTIEFAVGELARCTITDSAGSPIELTMPKPFTAGDLPVTFAACFAEQLYNFFGAVQRRERPVADGFDAARTAAHIEWAYSNRGLRAAPFGKTSKTIKQIEALTGPVVITGATGFIGTHLIEYLSARGFDQITALVRGPRNCANIARSPVQLETVDLLDYSQVRRAVRGMRYVFHLAYGRDGERRRETTIEGTRNVVKAAIDEACESVVVVSTAYVFGWPSRIVDESAPYRPTGGEYGRSKAEMERWCLRAASNSGRTRIVVLNPTCVYGPGGPTYSNLPVTLARSKGFCWINEGAGAANYTFVSNLVDAMLLGASNPDAHGERFIINDGTTTWRSFFSPILSPWLAGIPSYTRAELVRLEGAQRLGLFGAARLLARSPEARSIARKTSLGAAAANVCRRLRIATVGNELNRLSPRPVISGEQPPPPPRWLADLFPDHATRFSSEKAKRILGWTPRVDLETGQLRTIEHLVRIGLLPAPVEEFAVVH